MGTPGHVNAPDPNGPLPTPQEIAVRCIEIAHDRDALLIERNALRAALAAAGESLTAMGPALAAAERARATVAVYDRVINFDLTVEERLNFVNALPARFREARMAERTPGETE